jgi:tetratricopeptide (TPR) repeat protein
MPLQQQRVFFTFGMCLHLQNKDFEAAAFFRDACEIAERIEGRTGTESAAASAHWAADAFLKLDNLQQAERYYRLSFTKKKTLHPDGNDREMRLAENRLGGVLARLGLAELDAGNGKPALRMLREARARLSESTTWVEARPTIARNPNFLEGAWTTLRRVNEALHRLEPDRGHEQRALHWRKKSEAANRHRGGK